MSPPMYGPKPRPSVDTTRHCTHLLGQDAVMAAAVHPDTFLAAGRRAADDGRFFDRQ